MNERYLIGEEGVRDYVKDGNVDGFEFSLRVPYYMGVPLSQINIFKVRLDNCDIPSGDVRLMMKTGEAFKLSEILTVADYHWEYGEKLRVVVLQEGGLPRGKHRLEVEVGVDVIYMPKGIGGSKAYLDFEV